MPPRQPARRIFGEAGGAPDNPSSHDFGVEGGPLPSRHPAFLCRLGSYRVLIDRARRRLSRSHRGSTNVQLQIFQACPASRNSIALAPPGDIVFDRNDDVMGFELRLRSDEQDSIELRFWMTEVSLM